MVTLPARRLLQATGARKTAASLTASTDRGLPDLKRFLALTARRLCESCLYVEVAGSAVLLYSAEDEDLEADPCLASSSMNDEPSSAV